MTDVLPEPRRARRLVAGAVTAYVVMHHVGAANALGEVGQTRWADWADLATPWLVVLPLAAALAVSRQPAREWVLLVVAALAYTEGHGIHLAGNSVNNREPSDVAHLWDEVVGHWVWYSGAALLGVVAVRALARSGVPAGPLPWLLGLLAGTTWATNSLEGGTAYLGLAVAATALVWGARRGGRLGRLVAGSAVAAAAVVLGYAVAYGGFPQPSAPGGWPPGWLP
ncbi:hypothetical protein [Motilibacter aurantiacus]|uniref:hypothetical protein n=1 Tax=Motilibacter aurantiacus TaxID=2714955 RepID=UPI00140B8BC2|nr:hypothetical protein [Motilibacter aurantiacus]NHC46897.1 hypothetical protein [Motilibacter aurantiacus]